MANKPITGFRTAKDSIYTLIGDQSVRFKADITKTDTGLHEPAFVAFLNTYQASNVSSRITSYEKASLAVLKSGDEDRKRRGQVVPVGMNIGLGGENAFQIVGSFAEAEQLDRAVHLVMRDKETGRYVSFGTVQQTPAVGLSPLEMFLKRSPDGNLVRDTKHIGNKIAEVFHDTKSIEQSIKNLGYPVVVGASGHLEQPAAIIIGKPDTSSHNMMLLRNKDGQYSAIEQGRNGPQISQPFNIHYTGPNSVRLKGDAVDVAVSLKAGFTSHALDNQSMRATPRSSREDTVTLKSSSDRLLVSTAAGKILNPNNI